MKTYSTGHNSIKHSMSTSNPRIKYVCHGCNKMVGQVYSEPTKDKDGKAVIVYRCKKCNEN